MSKWETAAAGGRVVARLVVSGIWIAAAVVLFAAGSIIAGLVCLAYVAYLLLFGGRLLIY
jgi:hypothetical protein